MAELQIIAPDGAVPFVGLFDQLSTAVSSLQVSDMKSVEHEDMEDNNDFSVDPLADPRLDKMDLFNMVDTKDRDAVMNASESFVVSDSDFSAVTDSKVESSSDSGSGE